MKTNDHSVSCCILAACALAFAPEASLAQVVINAPPAVIGGNYELNANETLNVFDGGEVGNGFRANDGSVVNISNGSVGDFFYAYSGSEVNISGGSVGFRFEAFDSEVNISGGEVGHLFKVHGDSVVNITDGRVGSIEANSGSMVEITGGSIGGNVYSSIRASSGSSISVSGGAVGRSVLALSGSDVELVGGEFRLNGAEFTGDSITLTSGGIFTGTLSDGSTFIFSPLAGDELQAVTLTQAILPTLDLTPRIVDTPVAGGPFGLREGQTLTVQTGGQLPENFAVVNATLNVEGGAVGGGVEVVGSTVNFSGGILGGMSLISPQTINDFSSGLDVIDSVVNMSGGILGERSAARLRSVMNISGGTVGSKFYAAPGSEVNISGGVMAFDFWARTGSDVELIGGEYRLNGAAYTGSSITLNTGDVFTGTLADGSTFIFSPTADPLGDELVGVSLTQDTLPTLDLTPRVVNYLVTSGPSGLRSGQTLTVQPDGVLQDHFATVDAVLNVEGGVVGSGLEVDGSIVNITSGEVGSRFQTFGSEVNISGGEIGRSFSVHAGSTVNISGGTVNGIRSFSATEESIAINISGGNIVGTIHAFAGNIINMTGGRVDGAFRVFRSDVEISGGTISSFVASGDSVVNISGGTFLNNFSANFGNVVNISGGSFEGTFRTRSNIVSPENTINLFGTDFRIDGMLLDALEVGEAFTITDRGTTLSGLLADGSPFSFELNTAGLSGDFFSPEATLTVTLIVPEPASFTLLILGCSLLLRRRRSGSTRA